MMNGVDLGDPSQAETAIDVLSTVLTGTIEEPPTFKNIFPTTSTTTTEKGETQSSTTTTNKPLEEGTSTTVASTTPDPSKLKTVQELKNLIKVMKKMTDLGILNGTILEREFRNRIVSSCVQI